MMNVIIILVLATIFGALFIYQGMPLLRDNEIKELVLFSALLFTGFVVTVLQALGISIPSPAIFIEDIVKVFLGVFYA